jgi:hypothetical protein
MKRDIRPAPERILVFGASGVGLIVSAVSRWRHRRSPTVREMTLRPPARVLQARGHGGHRYRPH